MCTEMLILVTISYTCILNFLSFQFELQYIFMNYIFIHEHASPTTKYFIPKVEKLFEPAQKAYINELIHCLATLRQQQAVKLIWESVSQQLHIYTSSRHRASLSFIWSRVSGHQVNLRPIFTLCFWSLPTPEGTIWLFGCETLRYVHQLVAN